MIIGYKHYKDYIKFDDLEDRHTYKIYCRNSSVGIFLKENKSFLISRIKFTANYLFEEIHWDMDDSFGTVKPIEKIEKAPFDFELNEIKEQDQAEKVKKYLNKLEGPRKLKVMDKQYVVDEDGVREVSIDTFL